MTPIDKSKPKYHLLERTSTQILLRDVGHEDARPTITNKAEEVIKDLMINHGLKPGMQVFYYDSENELAEILYDVRITVRGFGPPTRQDQEGEKLDDATDE